MVKIMENPFKMDDWMIYPRKELPYLSKERAVLISGSTEEWGGVTVEVGTLAPVFQTPF